MDPKQEALDRIIVAMDDYKTSSDVDALTYAISFAINNYRAQTMKVDEVKKVDETLTIEDRLDRIEKRLARVEKALSW